MGGAREQGKGGARERGEARGQEGRGQGEGQCLEEGGSEPGSGRWEGSRGVEAVESGEGARGRGGLAGAGRARSKEKYEQGTEVHLRCPCPGWGASPAGNYSAAPECWEEAGNPITSDREAKAPSGTALPLACPAPGLGGAQAPVGNSRPILHLHPIAPPTSSLPVFHLRLHPGLRSDLSLRPNCALRSLCDPSGKRPPRSLPQSPHLSNGTVLV